MIENVVQNDEGSVLPWGKRTGFFARLFMTKKREWILRSALNDGNRFHAYYLCIINHIAYKQKNSPPSIT